VHNIRIKICGITRVEDAFAVVDAGAEALGLVFHPASPRIVSIEQAKLIVDAVGPFIVTTGLFVDADAAYVNSVLAQVPLQLLQFHGDESLAYCESFHRPYMKALRMKPELDVLAAIAAYPSATGILLDAYRPGVPGGTGETFDWARVPLKADKPIVLAGGLTPENVAKAIMITQVYGVDVSGGVESAPGKKDPAKIATFIKNAKKQVRG
jgi:phosphoribosylanthranilate isomerase